jgi:hypothetical protein
LSIRNPEIHCLSPNIVIVSQLGFLVVLGYIDHQVYFSLLDEFTRIGRTIFQWPVNDHTLDAVLIQKLRGSLSRKKADSQAFEQLCALDKGYFVFQRAGREQNVLIGNLKPTEIRAFKKASSKSSPRQPTSPVEAISTPKVGSAPCNLVNEKCGALTPT